MDQNGDDKDTFTMQDYYEFLNGLYPLTNYVDLCMVESQIQTDKTYQKILIRKLAKLKSGSLTTSIKNIMGKIFDDEFLKTYSYCNTRRADISRNFYELNICEVVFDTLLSEYSGIDIGRRLKFYVSQADHRFNNPTQ